MGPVINDNEDPLPPTIQSRSLKLVRKLMALPRARRPSWLRTGRSGECRCWRREHGRWRWRRRRRGCVVGLGDKLRAVDHHRDVLPSSPGRFPAGSAVCFAAEQPPCLAIASRHWCRAAICSEARLARNLLRTAACVRQSLRLASREEGRCEYAHCQPFWCGASFYR